MLVWRDHFGVKNLFQGEDVEAKHLQLVQERTIRCSSPTRPRDFRVVHYWISNA